MGNGETGWEKGSWHWGIPESQKGVGRAKVKRPKKRNRKPNIMKF